MLNEAELREDDSKEFFDFLESRVVSELNIKKDSVSDDAMCRIVHLPSDKTFYSMGTGCKRYENTPEFKALVRLYKAKGFSTRRPKEIGAYWKRVSVRGEANRKKAGHILWKDNYKDHTPEDYQGGFSNTVFNEPQLHDYITSGPTFGYIGHWVRKKSIDAYIETKFMALRPKVKCNLSEILACWLTSTDGRHFGDSLEGITLKAQKKVIDKDIKRMFNTAFIYNLPEHKGTGESTNALFSKYKPSLYTIS